MPTLITLKSTSTTAMPASTPSTPPSFPLNGIHTPDPPMYPSPAGPPALHMIHKVSVSNDRTYERDVISSRSYAGGSALWGSIALPVSRHDRQQGRPHSRERCRTLSSRSGRTQCPAPGPPMPDQRTDVRRPSLPVRQH